MSTASGMSPPSSVGDLLTPSGRLRRQWNAALEDPDPHSGLERLREVCARMEKRPDRAAPLWPGFLPSMVGQPFRPLLTEADFEALERTGAHVALVGSLPLDQALRPLVMARLGRGEGRQAGELLSRLYWAWSMKDAPRAALADDLARLGLRDVPRLDIYADLLGRAGPRPPAVLALAAEVLRVDFDSDPARLREAAALAGTGLPGADRAAGLHRLLVTAEPGTAGEHFLAACAADPRDGTALLGLLVSHVRSGRSLSIPEWAFDAARAAAPDVAAMAELARVLAWFDSDTDRPPPASAARLAALGPSREAGPWLAYARGRLHLLYGDAARARDLLVPLTADDSALPQWRYHAAWSQLLSGDRAGLRPLIGTMTRRPDDWALACLLLDTEPDAVPGTHAEHAAAAVPTGYERIAEVRRDLARGGRPGAAPERPGPGRSGEGGGAPERLEALRTALGEAYGRAAGAGDMAALLREPLYRRLPRADRLLWSGLLALRTEPEEGRRLLGAALTLGHERAALVLAAHHLESRRPARAHRLLAGRSGAKAELLSVWAEAVGGATDDAVADRLERLERLDRRATRRLPQVPYVLGAIGLHRMAGEGSTLHPDDAPYHAREAARHLAGAVAAGPGAAPRDAAVLLRAARAVAYGTVAVDGPGEGPSDRPGDGPGDGLSALWSSVQRHSWEEWVLGLALLAEDPEAVGPELCGRLAALAGEAGGTGESGEAGEAGEPSARAVTGLATALTAAGMRSADPRRRDALARLTLGLADRHALPEVRVLAARVTASAMVLPVAGRPPVRAARLPGPVQPTLALARAVEDLAGGDRASAVRQLRAAPDDSGVCGLLADVLDGRPPAAPPPDGTGERAGLVRVVHAAGLVESDPGRCLDLLSTAAADCDLATVTDIARLLPALLIPAGGKRSNSGGAPRRSGRPHPLAGVVRRLTDDGALGLDRALLAGCATAVQDYASAEALWRRALDQADQEGRDSAQVRAEYARLLCHRAVTARTTEDPLRSPEILRRVADVLPKAGPPVKRLPSRTGARSLARDLELDVCVGRLLDQVFPGAEREPVPWERPGRYPALEAVVETDGGLYRALVEGAEGAERTESADEEGTGGAEQNWARCLETLEYDVRLHHTLAVLYRDMALGAPAPTARAGGALAHATVLWALLLGSWGFWEQHGEEPAGPGTETRLRGAVCRELFGMHRRLGAEALRAGDADTARLHLLVLESAREGGSAVRSLLRDFGMPWSPAVDARRWAEISALAGTVTDEWCAEVVRTAEKATTNTAAIAELAEGIDKDYESGIRGLEPMIGLGIPLPRLLRTALEWHNGLQNCFYQMGSGEDVRKVTGRARKLADALVPLCVPGKGHVPDNRALGMHFVDRGLFVAQDNRAAIALWEEALKWDPGNTSAHQLLARKREAVRISDALESAERNLDAGRSDLVLRELSPLVSDPTFGERVRQLVYSAHLVRAVAALNSSDHPRLLSAAKEAYEVADSDKARSLTLVFQALSHINSGNPSEAVPLLAMAVHLDPSSETAGSLYNRFLN
ncbi:hypothetical protein [Streptomyces sp. NPDC091212]|uniref:hypothetical protein n=1 Tax=Streptomyces sp. NPDC091212 TaxID=3155191 RepID=UPI0034184530